MIKKWRRSKHNKDETLRIGSPLRYFCDRAFVMYAEDHFLLAFQSGTIVESQYVFTPEHAKRLMLRLQEKIEAYEKEHGVMEVSLPTE